MEIKSNDITLVDIESIVPNPKNANRHSPEQIKRLEKLIKYQGFRNPLIISNRTGFLIVGHGRLEAAKNLGIEKLPVIYQDFKDEAQEYAYLVSDNEIARWSDLDLNAVKEDILDFPDLQLDIDLLGIEDLDLNFLEETNLDEEKYTRKVESPIYEPKGEKPALENLYNTEKTDELLSKINQIELEPMVKNFLVHSAHRHTKFNYKYIAEYYAHADANTQRLMEQSALIIIDFDKAVENGFVELTKDIKETYLNEH